MFLHALLIDQIQVNRRLDEAVDDQPLCSWLDHVRVRREFAEIGDRRIEDHHLGLIDTNGLLDPDGGERIGLRQVRADHENRFRFGQIFPIVRCAADSERQLGGLHEIHVPVAGAAVQIVCPERHPHELLEQIELFIGAACRDQAGDGVGAVLLANVREPIDDRMHGLQPRDLHELVALAQQRPASSGSVNRCTQTRTVP